MQRLIHITVVILYLCMNEQSALFAQEMGDYFKIQVVDKETGRGVPLVELKTTNSICYYTDNNGIIAFYEPGLMDQKVFFYIKSHGYYYPADGLGYSGKAIEVTKGGSALIEIERVNIAERLYRITGQGLYHHSLLLGQPSPIHNPVLNSKVMGQDAGFAIPYRDKLYWFWGDSDQPSYPLGNFATPGATSEWTDDGGLNPAVGIDLTYFENEKGFCKRMFPLSEFPGPGPKWLSCLMTIKDENGIERLIAQYKRMKDLSEPYESALAIFNDETGTFERLVQLDLNATLHPEGNAYQVSVGGQEYYYFAILYPNSMFVRVKAGLIQITDTKTYEAFTCLVSGSRYNKSSPSLDRDSDGRLIYAWKVNTSPIGYAREQELISAGHMKPEEAWFHLQDINSGTPIETYSGSVHWNDFRKRWIMIVQQNVGEVWYAEGDTPVGPWIYARKIVTHHNYTFYLPKQHPFFDQDGGRLIYFEGTYTNSFSGNPDKTPRYNYNQIMYRLNLNDPQLYLPGPVYTLSDIEGNSTYMMRDAIDSLNLWKRINGIPFFAIPENRKLDGMIPVYLDKTNGKYRLTTKPQDVEGSAAELLFYGLPAFISKKEQISGTWEFKVDNYPFAMDLLLEGNKINGLAYGQLLEFNKGTISNDTIELNFTDSEEQVTYILKVQIKNGKLNGKYEGVENNISGIVTGKRMDLFWKLYTSPTVIPVYEYQNDNGEFHYSTDSGLTLMKRSEKPICHIWRNPTTMLALDFEAKPLLYNK